MTAPKCPCFIDSNIWIYAATQSQDNPPDPRHETARQIIAQVQPCLSVQVINEVTVNLLRKFNFSEAEILSTLLLGFTNCWQCVATSMRPFVFRRYAKWLGGRESAANREPLHPKPLKLVPQILHLTW